MKIKIITKQPRALLDALKKMMDDQELKTWKVDSSKTNPILFNHTPEQWLDQVLLKPTINIDNEYLLIEINHWAHIGEPDDKKAGYVLGRFIEILIVHFQKYYEKIEIIK